MLTRRMQIQAIADRLAGLPVESHIKDFEMPWQLCWQAITQAQPGTEHESLNQCILGLQNPKEIQEKIMAIRPGYRPQIISLDELAMELRPIEWVWNGWIPRGMLTALGASQGSGKSFVATDLAWRIIHNQGYPDGSPVKRLGANVIYVDGEAVPQILNDRTRNYQLDRSKLFVMLPDTSEMIDLGAEKYRDRLSEMAAILQPELIIIDSLLSVISSGHNSAEDLRGVISFLVRLAASANCGLVLIHHIHKPPSGNAMMNFEMGMEDLSGAGYITQQARVVLGLRVVKTGPEFGPNGPRELKVLKNNLGAYPSRWALRLCRSIQQASFPNGNNRLPNLTGSQPSATSAWSGWRTF